MRQNTTRKGANKKQRRFALLKTFFSQCEHSFRPPPFPSDPTSGSLRTFRFCTFVYTQRALRAKARATAKQHGGPFRRLQLCTVRVPLLVHRCSLSPYFTNLSPLDTPLAHYATNLKAGDPDKTALEQFRQSSHRWLFLVLHCGSHYDYRHRSVRFLVISV